MAIRVLLDHGVPGEFAVKLPSILPQRRDGTVGKSETENYRSQPGWLVLSFSAVACAQFQWGGGGGGGAGSGNVVVDTVAGVVVTKRSVRPLRRPLPQRRHNSAPHNARSIPCGARGAKLFRVDESTRARSPFHVCRRRWWRPDSWRRGLRLLCDSFRLVGLSGRLGWQHAATLYAEAATVLPMPRPHCMCRPVPGKGRHATTESR